MTPPVETGNRSERVGRRSDPPGSPDATDSPVAGIPLDVMYGLLKNRRRRLVLHYLVNKAEHRAVLGTLATQIAAWENDIPVSAVTSKLRKRTYNTLQQTHLPKMDEARVIDYDHHRGTVELTASPADLELFLTVLPNARSVWTRSFIAAGFVLWLVLASNWVAVHLLHLYRPGSAGTISGLSLFLVFLGFVQLYRLFQ